MYEMKKELTFTQCGVDGRLKLHEAVAMMSDCCQFQEYQETGLKKYLQDNGIAIFLSSMQIRKVYSGISSDSTILMVARPAM